MPATILNAFAVLANRILTAGYVAFTSISQMEKQRQKSPSSLPKAMEPESVGTEIHPRQLGSRACALHF